jgi:hypothetical protein
MLSRPAADSKGVFRRGVDSNGGGCRIPARVLLLGLSAGNRMGRLCSAISLLSLLGGCKLPSIKSLDLCSGSLLQSSLSGPVTFTHNPDFTEDRLDFGQVLSAPVTATWTLTNPSPIPAQVLKRLDTADPNWNVDLHQGQILPANGSLAIAIDFTPTQAGAYSHQITVVTSSCLLSSVLLTLEGTLIPGNALVPTRSPIVFGPLLDDGSATSALTVSNDSDLDLDVRPGAVTGPTPRVFAVFPTAGLRIGAHRSASFTAVFTPPPEPPPDPQIYEGEASLSYCPADSCTLNVSLVAGSASCIRVAPTVTDFGNRAGSAPVTIHNYCDQPFPLSIAPVLANLFANGVTSNDGAFEQGPDWPAAGALVPAQGELVLTVIFAPYSHDDYFGSLLVAFDDPLPGYQTVHFEGAGGI